MKQMAGWLRAVLCCVGLLVPFAPAQAGSLTVAVAASVKYVFSDLAAEFTRETGIEAKGAFGASGMLTAQIKSGAPFDVFLSADMKFPDSLYKDGVAVDAPKVYANGALVLWTMNPLNLGKGIQVLNDPAVRKVALANPELAPYGREAINALEYFKLHEAVKSKLVYGESISQVNQYIDSRSADIGFTAKSVVLAPEMRGKGKWVELPQECYKPIAQGAVLLRYGSIVNPAAARRFMEFLSSPAARGILEKYGYRLS